MLDWIMIVKNNFVSSLNDTLKIALSNRYEAETVVIIPLDISRDITMYQVNGNGLELINTFNMTTEINITLPPYHLVYLTSKKPAEGSNAEISCTGNLQLRRQRPGSSVSGSFDVSNTGAENTLLSWEIASLPDWGEWQASPSEGFNLSSDDQPVTVIVTGIIPKDENKEYFGHIKIVNRENRSNQCLMPVSVSTPKIPLPPFVDYIQQLLTFFFKNTVLFQLLPLF
jgi:hypothetical protein